MASELSEEKEKIFKKKRHDKWLHSNRLSYLTKKNLIANIYGKTNVPHHTHTHTPLLKVK